MMQDFSYCTGDNCPLKDHCRRYLESFESAMKWVMPSYDELTNKCVNYVEQ